MFYWTIHFFFFYNIANFKPGLILDTIWIFHFLLLGFWNPSNQGRLTKRIGLKVIDKLMYLQCSQQWVEDMWWDFWQWDPSSIMLTFCRIAPIMFHGLSQAFWGYLLMEREVRNSRSAGLDEYDVEWAWYQLTWGTHWTAGFWWNWRPMS